jgi:hypothetical protein
MTTNRSTYLRGIADALAADTGLKQLGVVLGRSVWYAAPRTRGRVLVVSRGRDVVVDTNIGRTTRNFIMSLSAIVWSPTPDDEADEIFSLSHPVVMSYSADGMLGITEGPTLEPQVGDEDGGMGILTMQYAIEYQTAPNAL